MSRLETLTDIKAAVSLIFVNAETAKSRGRSYSRETARAKAKELTKHLEVATAIEFSENDQQAYVTRCKVLQQSIIDIARNCNKLLDEFSQQIPSYSESPTDQPEDFPEPELTTMADFKFETGLKLPTLVDDCDIVAVRDFLDVIESYHEVLNAAGKTALISFILKNRLQGKAKTRVGQQTANTFAELKEVLLTTLGVKETIESLNSKLSTLRQGKKSLTEYVEELDLTALKLANLQVKALGLTEDIAVKAVNQTIRQQALMSFKRGVHDELKTVIEANQPKSLEDALAVATSANVNTQASMFYFGRGRGQRSRGQAHRGQSSRGKPQPNQYYRGQNSDRRPNGNQGRARGTWHGQSERYSQHSHNYRGTRGNNRGSNNNYGRYNNSQHHVFSMDQSGAMQGRTQPTADNTQPTASYFAQSGNNNYRFQSE